MEESKGEIIEEEFIDILNTNPDDPDNLNPLTEVKYTDEKYVKYLDEYKKLVNRWQQYPVYNERHNVIKAIRENKLLEHTTFLVLSNQGQQVDFDMAKKYSVDGYVVKALATPTEVLQEVEKVYKEKHS